MRRPCEVVWAPRCDEDEQLGAGEVAEIWPARPSESAPCVRAERLDGKGAWGAEWMMESSQRSRVLMRKRELVVDDVVRNDG